MGQIYQGSNKIKKIMAGGTAVQKVYQGNILIWSYGADLYAELGNGWMKLSPSFDIIWHNTSYGGIVMAVTGDGYVFSSRGNEVYLINPQGEHVWTYENVYRAIIRNQAAATANGRFIYSEDDTDHDGMIALSSSGTKLWEQDEQNWWDGRGIEYRMIVATPGNYIIAGYYYGGWSIERYSSTNGNVLSGDYGSTGGLQVRGLTVDKDSYIYNILDGKTLRKYNINGDLVKSKTFTNGISLYDIDYNNHLYIGELSTDTIKKLDSNFNEIWAYQIPSELNIAHMTSLDDTEQGCVDKQGNFYVLCMYFVTGSQRSLKILSLDSDGRYRGLYTSTFVQSNPSGRIGVAYGKVGAFANKWASI